MASRGPDVLAKVMPWFPTLGAHDVEALLTWAIGDDWTQVKFAEWPSRIRQRTALQVADDDRVIDVTAKLTEEWKNLQNGQQTLLPLETPETEEPSDVRDAAAEFLSTSQATPVPEPPREPQDLLREALSPVERYGPKETPGARPGDYVVIDFDANPFNIFTFGSLDEAKRFMKDRPPALWEGEGRYLVAKVAGWATAKVELTMDIQEG
jgi:hypothetical protein